MSNNSCLLVPAKYVSIDKIYYECPFCWTCRRTKRQFSSNRRGTGRIVKSRVPTLHHHGNETRKINHDFKTSRSSHCQFNDTPVDIFVSKYTEQPPS